MEKLEEKCELEQRGGEPINGLFWKSLFGITSEQVMMLDPKGKVLFTNKGLFGKEAHEAVGQSIFKIVPSAYAIILQSKLDEVIRTRDKVSFDSVIETKNGRKNLELVIAPVYDEAVLLGYTLASKDTTEIKSALKNFNYKSNLEKLFLNISTKFINLPSEHIDKGINESLELISRFTNSEHAYIVLFDNEHRDDGYEWHVSLSVNAPFCNLNTVQVLLKQGIKRLKETEPVLIKPGDLGVGLKNDCPILVNPMMLESKRYGALVLVGKVNSETDWSEDFAKPMMLFSNVFINTLERKKNSIVKKQRELALEEAIKQRTLAIENQKDKLFVQAHELAKTEALLRQANDKLTIANSSLEKTVFQRTSSLEKTNQELDRFVYSVSHDIKAPLSSVQGLVNLIRMSPVEELDFHLELIEKSIGKLNGFVEDILVHSRNGRVELKKDIIDFDREIELAAEELRHMDSAHNVKLITSINGEVNAVTDQYRLQSVLKNLISNSVKYHNAEAKKSWVKVVVTTSKERIKIKVSDNGIGISAERVDKVFDMFYRASEKSFGSGLGLYIVKETIEKLGGTITVASQEHVGTTFNINIPNLG